MKKMFLIPLLAALLVSVSGCEKTAGDDFEGGSCSLPHNAAPSGLTGEWVNGYTSFTQVINAYNGRNLGSTWQSGKYFKFTEDGTKAFLYVMAQSQYSAFATKVADNIEFDEGFTEESGSFTFYACNAHYKGWGSQNVDREATDEELQNNLSDKYYYEMQGQWLRISPGSPVNDYTSSFRRIE